ncbi:MAG: ATP cone domain-containing protein, partial [Planctomycetota bacterium]
MNQQIREVTKRNKQTEPYQPQYLFESLQRANMECGYDQKILKEVCETIELFLKSQPQDVLATSAIREMVIKVLDSRYMENLNRTYQSFHQKRMDLYSDVLVHNLDEETPPALFSKPCLLESLQHVWGFSRARSRELEHWIEEQLIRMKIMVVTNRLIRSLIENKCFTEGYRSNFALGQKIGFYQMDLEQEIFFFTESPDHLAQQIGHSILQTFQNQDLLTPEIKEYLKNEQLEVSPLSPIKWVSGCVDENDSSLLEYSERYSFWDIQKLGLPPASDFQMRVLHAPSDFFQRNAERVYEESEWRTSPQKQNHLCFQPSPGHLVQETTIPLKTLKGIVLLDDLNQRLDAISLFQMCKWKFLNTLGASHQFNSKNTVYARWIRQPSYCQIALLASQSEDVDSLQEILDLTLLKIQSFQDTNKINYRAVLRLGKTEIEFSPRKERVDYKVLLKN